jgi:hypothetical protein
MFFIFLLACVVWDGDISNLPLLQVAYGYLKIKIRST